MIQNRLGVHSHQKIVNVKELLEHNMQGQLGGPKFIKNSLITLLGLFPIMLQPYTVKTNLFSHVGLGR